MKRPSLKQGVDFSHSLLKRHLKQGDRVVDATAGNGYDTVFLAQLVGKTGRVWSFDLQKKAIERTENKIRQKGLTERVELICDGHERIQEYVSSPIQGVIFNLGFLPGSDKEIITTPETTLPALRKSLKLVVTGGIIVIVVYTGHSGGEKEKDALIGFCANLSDEDYNVLHYHFINQTSLPPQVIAIKVR